MLLCSSMRTLGTNKLPLTFNFFSSLFISLYLTNLLELQWYGLPLLSTSVFLHCSTYKSCDKGTISIKESGLLIAKLSYISDLNISGTTTLTL